MMSRNALISLIKTNEPGLRRLGVRHLALFGSYARGSATADSDLDVLVDLSLAHGAGDKIAVGRAALAVSGTLSEITGLDVGLIERRRVPPGLAERIRDDLVEVF